MSPLRFIRWNMVVVALVIRFTVSTTGTGVSISRTCPSQVPPIVIFGRETLDTTVVKLVARFPAHGGPGGNLQSSRLIHQDCRRMELFPNLVFQGQAAEIAKAVDTFGNMIEVCFGSA